LWTLGRHPITPSDFMHPQASSFVERAKIFAMWLAHCGEPTQFCAIRPQSLLPCVAVHEKNFPRRVSRSEISIMLMKPHSTRHALLLTNLPISESVVSNQARPGCALISIGTAPRLYLASPVVACASMEIKYFAVTLMRADVITAPK
jgi:hypothetical protein